eukprot:3754752-Rhodomonas_salina.2
MRLTRSRAPTCFQLGSIRSKLDGADVVRVTVWGLAMPNRDACSIIDMRLIPYSSSASIGPSHTSDGLLATSVPAKICEWKLCQPTDST